MRTSLRILNFRAELVDRYAPNQQGVQHNAYDITATFADGLTRQLKGYTVPSAPEREELEKHFAAWPNSWTPLPLRSSAPSAVN